MEDLRGGHRGIGNFGRPSRPQPPRATSCRAAQRGRGVNRVLKDRASCKEASPFRTLPPPACAQRRPGHSRAVGPRRLYGACTARLVWVAQLPQSQGGRLASCGTAKMARASAQDERGIRLQPYLPRLQPYPSELAGWRARRRRGSSACRRTLRGSPPEMHRVAAWTRRVAGWCA